MGGSIAVTMRLPDGKLDIRSRWTNPMPYFIKSPKFFDEDANHIREYLREPAEDHAWPYIAPFHYGLVVIDYKTKTILSMQSYTSLESILFIPNVEPDIPALFTAGRIKQVRYATKHDEPDHWKVFRAKSVLKARRRILRDADRTEIAFVDLKTDPWEFRRFAENEDGQRDLRAAIQDLGLTLEPGDMKAWKSFTQERGSEE